MSPKALLRYLWLPLQAPSLSVILILGVLITASVAMGVYGIFVFVVACPWFFKYGFALLDEIVDGRLQAPVLSSEMVNPVEQRPLGLFLLLFVGYAVTGWLSRWLGDGAVTTLRVVLMAAVPAMVATMSVTGQFFAALNPVVVFRTIARIPFAYAALLVVIGAMWFVPAMMLRANSESLAELWAIDSFFPGGLLAKISVTNGLIGMSGLMLFMYLWLAMFACIGGTIYERRQELDVEPAKSPERTAARANAELERERDKIMDRVFAEVRGGAFANAGETVRKLVEQSVRPLDECRWLYARAAAADSRLAGYLAQLTLPRLLDARATGEALRMVRERLAATPDFKPEKSAHLLRLAQLARDAGDRATARRLLSDFERRFPNDVLAPSVAALQAELMR